MTLVALIALGIASVAVGFLLPSVSRLIDAKTEQLRARTLKERA